MGVDWAFKFTLFKLKTDNADFLLYTVFFKNPTSALTARVSHLVLRPELPDLLMAYFLKESESIHINNHICDKQPPR